MAIEVIKPGLSTTVQDLGRTGYYHLGIPPSGGLDRFSLRAANLLVGNRRRRGRARMRLHGARAAVHRAEPWSPSPARRSSRRSNGDAQPSWTSFAVSAGDVLSFGYLKAGARAYIAVAGRHRRARGAGQPLDLRARRARRPRGPSAAGRRRAAGRIRGADGEAGQSVPEDLRPDLPSEVEIRVVMGLYDHRLADAGRETFFDDTWTLTPVADRIGFRYKGGELEMVEREQPFGAGSDPSNIVDAPYPIGSIQVPGGVEPIILHRDAVSGGGYVMVAHGDLRRHGLGRPVRTRHEDPLRPRRSGGRPGGPAGAQRAHIPAAGGPRRAIVEFRAAR